MKTDKLITIRYSTDSHKQKKGDIRKYYENTPQVFSSPIFLTSYLELTGGSRKDFQL